MQEHEAPEVVAMETHTAGILEPEEYVPPTEPGSAGTIEATASSEAQDHSVPESAQE